MLSFTFLSLQVLALNCSYSVLQSSNWLLSYRWLTGQREVWKKMCTQLRNLQALASDVCCSSEYKECDDFFDRCNSPLTFLLLYLGNCFNNMTNIYDNKYKDIIFNNTTVWQYRIIYKFNSCLWNTLKYETEQSFIMHFSTVQRKHAMYENAPRLLLHLPSQSHSSYLFLPVIKYKHFVYLEIEYKGIERLDCASSWS